jgi:transcriptional regulator with AAA-type ATPase domain
MWAASLLLVLGLVLTLGPGRARTFGDLVLDPLLQVTDESVPTGPIRTGDRVIALQDVAVDSAYALMAALGTGTGPTSLTLELAGRRETLELTGRSFEGELPQPLLLPHTIVAIQGEPADAHTTVDQLRERVMLSGGAPFEVEVEYTDRATGTVVVETGPIRPFDIAWLCIGAGLVILAATRRGLNQDGFRQMSLSLAAAGTVPLGGLTAAMTHPFAPRLLVWWSLSLCALWFGAWIRLQSRARRAGPALVLLTAGPPALLVVAFVVVAFGSPSWVSGQVPEIELLGAALVVAYACWLAPGAFRTSSFPVLAVGAVIGTCSLAVAGLTHGGASPAWLCAGAIGAMAGPWLLALVADGAESPVTLSAGRSGRRSTEPAGEGAVSLLQRIAQQRGVDEASLAVGLDSRFVLLRVTGASDEWSLSTTVANEAMSDALGMLVSERTSFPSPRWQERADDDEHNPFVGVFARLGIHVALLLPQSDQSRTLEVLLLVRGTDDVDLDALQTAAADISLEHLVPELAVAAWTKLASLPPAQGAPSQTVVVTLPPSMSGDISTSVSIQPVRQSEATHAAAVDSSAARLASYLLQRSGARHALDDPSALTESEWRVLEPYAATSRPMLIFGEAGIGKEFLARAIHATSDRSEAAFLCVDCSSEPAGVIFDELCGEDGEVGLITAAARGTLLLKSASILGEDRMQAVLRMCGSSDVRLIVAERYEGEGAAIPASVNPVIRRSVGDRYLPLTPLRERRSDVERYARVFCHTWSLAYAREVIDLDEAAADYLGRLDLPGNFHDLRAIVRAAVLRSESGLLTLDDLAGSVDAQPSDEDASDYDDAEREQIISALARTDGNRSEAARQLGMTRGKLLRRMKRYELQ